MSKGLQFAIWQKVGRVWVVHPPGWPKNVELSFAHQEDMTEWARGAGVMLKDGNRRQDERFAKRSARRDMATV